MAGCDVLMPKTTARIVSKPYAKPFLAALEEFHMSNKQYPKNLDELRSEYPKPFEGLESLYGGTLYEKIIEDKGKKYIDWTISYKKETNDSYIFSFQRGETDASYRNGKLISSDSNWTR